MKIDRNNVLLAYVLARDPSYTWRGVRITQRPAHVAAAARAIWTREMKMTPEEYLAAPGPKTGMLPGVDAMHARLIQEYSAGPDRKSSHHRGR